MSLVRFATTDLLDANEAELDNGTIQVLQPGLIALGRPSAFCGPVVTLKLFEDNSLLADLVKEAGAGRVAVVDAGGSLRCGVFGGNLAATAARNGWAGVVIYGNARATPTRSMPARLGCVRWRLTRGSRSSAAKGRETLR